MVVSQVCRDRAAIFLRGAMAHVPVGLYCPRAERRLSGARRCLCVVLCPAHSRQSSADVYRFRGVYALAYINRTPADQRSIQAVLGYWRRFYSMDLLEMGIRTQSPDLSRDLSFHFPLAPGVPSHGGTVRLPGMENVPARMADGILRGMVCHRDVPAAASTRAHGRQLPDSSIDRPRDVGRLGRRVRLA